MSKRIFKAWGLILTIMLLVSIFVPASPAAALYGQSQWLSQNLPTNNSYVMWMNSDVSDLAAGPGVLYAVDGANVTASDNGTVFKSTDGGTSWTKSTVFANLSLKMIAVAPDNANVIAVTDGNAFWVSSDAGSTWSNLTTTAIPAGTVITGIAVAPARSGTLLGREYVMSLANATTATTTNGDVQIIGNTATWTSILPTGWVSTRDWMAVAITPNFVGDRSVVALGAGNLAGPTAGVIVGVFNTANTATYYSANLTSSTTTTDFGSGNVAGILNASIALPADFDATTSSGRRSYVGFGATTPQTDNDVYRVDDTAAKALGAVTAQNVYSVAYSGTVSSGTIFEARADTAEIKYSTDMTGGSPTWTATKKLMPTTTTQNVVMLAPDFATSKKIYTGTSGAESAFSISNDGGISFNQKSLIDNGTANNVVKIEGGPSLLSNGKSFLMNTIAGGRVNLWKSDAPSSDTSWTRIWVAPATSGSVDKINDNVYLLYDVTAGGNIYRTADGGATWNTRFTPSGYTVSTDAFQDENIGWITDSSGNIYKTTNGAWTWTGPVAANVGTICQLTTGRTDELIVGGTGMFAISKDGGTTFTTYTGDSGVGYKITKDTNYTTNNILWLGDKTATIRAAYKFTVGTDAKPVDLLVPITTAPAATGNITAVNMRSGALYIAYGDQTYRTLNPYDTPGTITWKQMPQAASQTTYMAGTLTSAKDVNSILYIRTGNPPSFYALEDQMATAKPVITAPSTNLSLSVNPVTGVGDLFTLVMQPVGTGNSLADKFDVQVAEQSAGWAAATSVSAITVTQPTSPQISSGTLVTGGANFSANRVYQLRVRANHEISGASLDSVWSDPLTIKVASGGIVQQSQYGPVMVGPQGGATNVSLTPGFAWAPVFGANSYRIIIATDAALTKTVGGTPKDVTSPSFQPTTPLANDTTYFWSVQVIDPSVGPISVGTFSTAPKAAPAPTTGGGTPTFTIPPITIPPIVIPPQPTPTITVNAPPAVVQTTTPAFIWAVIIIGAILVIAVIVLIVRTRRVP